MNTGTLPAGADLPTAFEDLVTEIVAKLCKDLHSEVRKALTTTYGDRVTQAEIHSIKIDHETLKESLEEKDERIEELEGIIEEAQSELCGLEESLESVAGEVGNALTTLGNA
jgi:predicted nuclease with TOPRIM domain